MYFVRYVDPKAAKEARNFFGRLFGSGDEAGAAVRYRLSVRQASADKSVLAVQNAAGAADKSEPAQQMVQVLLAELR